MRGSVRYALSKGNPLAVLWAGRVVADVPVDDPDESVPTTAEKTEGPPRLDTADRRFEGLDDVQVVKSETGWVAYLDTGLDALGIGHVEKGERGIPPLIDTGLFRQPRPPAPVPAAKTETAEPEEDRDPIKGAIDRLSEHCAKLITDLEQRQDQPVTKSPTPPTVKATNVTSVTSPALRDAVRVFKGERVPGFVSLGQRARKSDGGASTRSRTMPVMVVKDGKLTEKPISLREVFKNPAG